MKTYFSTVVLVAWLFFLSCGGMFLADESGYALEFPELPYAWQTMLGSPSWRVEWFDGEGRKRAAEVSGKAVLEVSLPGTMANPVIALPFWPEKGIAPGVFRPAGAIFPFDLSENRLALSWQGGVDAAFFLELARAANGGLPTGGSAALRLPWNFNWPRFRRLFDDPALNDEIRADPWLADWPDIADRTVRSGFDRRRLVPQAVVAIEIPLGPGPWVGVSPFAAPLVFEGRPVFPVRSTVETWVSAEGFLRASAEAWIWREFESGTP